MTIGSHKKGTRELIHHTGAQGWGKMVHRLVGNSGGGEVDMEKVGIHAKDMLIEL